MKRVGEGEEGESRKAYEKKIVTEWGNMESPRDLPIFGHRSMWNAQLNRVCHEKKSSSHTETLRDAVGS